MFRQGHYKSVSKADMHDNITKCLSRLLSSYTLRLHTRKYYTECLGNTSAKVLVKTDIHENITEC